jgi:two-component system copper resistance phosphate regulon response regulator CusR
MRLLLIEDDPRVSRFIKKGLEAERYRVDIAEDGEEGLHMGLTGHYDLVILDVVLPLRSGIDLCRELRLHEIKVPVLMLTAKDAVEDKVAGLEGGADDYLTKPFAFEELLARIHALLRRPGELALSPVLQIADLSLDMNTHKVTRAGRTIELTPTEYSLLEYLMRRANRVLSRTLIEEQVWSYHHDPSSNVVDVYIRRLRAKVDDGFERKLIHTKRGAGYLLGD